MNVILHSLTTGKNNNYNLIRFLAATAVLISHCYPLYYGSGTYEPLYKYIERSMGAIAVDIFFMTSGFLIASSFIHKKSIKKYIWNRVIRIYPGLWAALFFTTVLILVLPAHSSIDLLSSTDTYNYLLLNSILLLNVEHTINGVFESNPFNRAVNGSLWTLPWEIYCYIGIASIILSCKKLTNESWQRIYIFGTIPLTLYCVLVDNEVIDQSKVLNIVSLFYIGSLYRIFQKKIIFTYILFAASIFLTLANIITINSLTIYFLLTPYILFFLAYIPSGTIRKFNNFGDYSYGIYIYAFPIQQSIMSVEPDISFPFFLASSLLITFGVAYLSWNYIEKPALSYKNLI